MSKPPASNPHDTPEDDDPFGPDLDAELAEYEKQVNLTPDQLKQKRTTALSNFTRVVNRIRLNIARQASRSVIKELNAETVILYNTVTFAHDAYVDSLKLEEFARAKEEIWHDKLKEKAAQIIAEVETFMAATKSTCESVTSSNSFKSASQLQAQEAKKKRLTSELKTKQEISELNRSKERQALELRQKRESMELETRQNEERLKEKLVQSKLEENLAKLDTDDEHLDDQASDADSTPPKRNPRATSSPNTNTLLDYVNRRLGGSSSNHGDQVQRALGRYSDGEGSSHKSSKTKPAVKFTEPDEEEASNSKSCVNDSWIEEDVLKSNANSSARISTRFPDISLSQFSGDPREWPLFICNFKSLVHDVAPDDSRRMAMLTKALPDSAKKVISFALGNPGLYHLALKTLKKKYGHPKVIASAHLAAIKSLPHVSDPNDFAGLYDFSISLSGAVGALVATGYDHELTASSLLHTILEKTPLDIQRKWSLYEYDRQPKTPTIIDFDIWLERQASGPSWIGGLDSKRSGSTTTKPRNDKKKPQSKSPSPSFNSFATHETVPPATLSTPCPFCDTKHGEYCPVFDKLSLDERSVAVRKKGCCYRCLVAGHIARMCTVTKKCGIDGCMRSHHQKLHGAPRVNPPPVSASEKKAEPSGTVAVCTNTGLPNPAVLLAVVNVIIEYDGRVKRIRALLDPGSQVTLINEEVAREMRMEGPLQPLHLTTVHGADSVGRRVRKVNFRLSSLDGNTNIHVECAYAIRRLCLSQNRVDVASLKREWSHLAGIEFNEDETVPVEALIGMDVVASHEILDLRKPSRRSNGPRAILTPFGWCIVGPTHVPNSNARNSDTAQLQVGHISHLSAERSLHEIGEYHFSIDSMGVKRDVPKPISAEDARALEILNTTTEHIGDRYQVGLMWKTPAITLPDNQLVALRRFYNLEQRFKKDPEFARNYAAVINEYIHLGHARRLRADELKGPAGKVWYLPHHGVVHPAKPGKPRVVFDCSARYRGMSLNDVLLKGPDLLASLVGRLLRFRQNKIAMSADVAKMYHQVRVRPDDQAVLRFMWREPGSAALPEVYQMTVHVFGAVSSPTTCLFILRKTAEDFGYLFPCVANKVDEFYVDNYLDSVKSEEEAIVIHQQLTALLAKGGFPLVKWQSSSRAVLATVKPDERCHPTLDLDLDNLPIDRTLGLLWNCETDCFVFKISVRGSAETKREILRETASTFDPLGFLAPVILVAKGILQDIWRAGTGWDEVVPESILVRWKTWTETLPSLCNLQIPRWFQLRPMDPVSMSLHVFTDASEKGFGAVVYVASTFGDGTVDLSFVMGKARVTPIVPHSIPRLELQGAVIGLRLATAASRFLNLEFSETIFWTDSQTVLQWINSRTCRFTAFVANRIGEILEGSRAEQWKYVPTALNPADDASRGLQGSDLTTDHRWLRGPDFLRHENLWPQPLKLHEPDTVDSEVIEPLWCSHLEQGDSSTIEALLLRSSNWLQVLRIVAQILRFTRNCRHPASERELTPWLQVAEMRSAWSALVKLSQQVVFKEELISLGKGETLPEGSRLATLSPFIGDDGILRVGGRLANSDLVHERKHPAILDPSHRVAELIIWHVHQQVHHAGVERTLAGVREVAFVLRARSAVRRCLRNCFTCKKLRAEPEVPLMAALPRHRVQVCSRPFLKVGIDYFGPMQVTILRRTQKRYGCLITCLATRAVHIEICNQLDVDSFLMAFDRFALRRGFPTVVCSDNGTNLKAGEKEIRQALDRWNQSEIGSKMAARHVSWIFNPPSAPHFGGVWERLVQSAKRALRATLTNRTVTDEILVTAAAEAENAINSRPLTYVSVDPEDPEPLTPNHFLIGTSNPTRPLDHPEMRDPPLRKRLVYSQMLADLFWRRWMDEYVPFLIERRKWLKDRRNVKEGDIVLVVDRNTPRGEWPVGRILRPNPSPDGRVRTALVKTRSGEYLRPVAKLCLLEETEE